MYLRQQDSSKRCRRMFADLFCWVGEKRSDVIIIIQVFWMQDMILYVLIIVLETELFFVAELHRLIVPELVYSRASNVCTLGDIISSSGNEFQGFITPTAKLVLLISSLDGCALSFNECPLLMVLFDNSTIPAVFSESQMLCRILNTSIISPGCLRYRRVGKFRLLSRLE